MSGQSTGQPGLRELSSAECTRLLESQSRGRVAVVAHNGQPLIFPVNYVFADGVVVFKTAAGTKLALAAQSLAAFEIDQWDETGDAGWSVLALGVAHEVTSTLDAASARLRRLAVRPAAPGEREHWVGLYVHEITGRSF